MRRLSTLPLVSLASLASLASLVSCLAPGCGGAPVDRETTLSRLRDAMEVEIPQDDPTVLEDHNRLVEDVRDGNVLDGMRRFEVQEALGRGQQCGTRELCARHEFRPDDWVYEVGRRDGMPWGPTIIIGFDRQGVVQDVYTLTRR